MFNNYWATKQQDVITTFTNVFNLDCHNLFNNMQAEVSLNPICPRNINNNSFTVFYKDDENKFLKTALHEIIHFIWFHIWQKHFQDDKNDYEAPHLKWILSEMVIDTFVSNTEISKLLSQANHKNMAYTYFYTMEINNYPILETLSHLFQKSPNITSFMEEAYQYCLDNEAAIRKQIP